MQRRRNEFPERGLAVQHGENKAMIGRNYFVRQATMLLKLAQSTKDPNLAATLIDRAAKIKAQIDDAPAAADPSPQAPDVQRQL
jgi:hypothetical protein